MKIQDVDFGLYIITDIEAAGSRMIQEAVRLALEGGATVIQYRDKNASMRNLLSVGQQLRTLTREHKAALIVNDRPDLAIALEADGVNIGPEDMPPQIVRQVVGKDMLIGVSASSVEEAEEAQAAGADFIVARPVFPPRWRTDGRPIMGEKGLAGIVRKVALPVIGVGGINMDNLHLVYEAGAAGAGIISAVLGAEDPRTATTELKRLIDSYRSQPVAGS